MYPKRNNERFCLNRREKIIYMKEKITIGKKKKKHINKPLIIVKKQILKKYKNFCSIYDNHNEQQNNAHENKKQDIKIIKYRKESKKNVSFFFFFPLEYVLA